MLSVEEALKRVLSVFAPLPEEKQPLIDVLGQVLYSDLVSNIDIPPLDNSAMDGYALKADDTKRATNDSPVTLNVVGTIAAGDLPNLHIRIGEAIRIMTGAPIPKGADAVIPFEETNETRIKDTLSSQKMVGITKDVNPGDHIRPAGQDVSRHQLVLKQGTELRPPEIGVIASLGYSHASVYRKPIVCILSTGNELMEPGNVDEPGKIFDSNGASIAAAVLKHGGIPMQLGIAGDSFESVESKLVDATQADLVITSAGVSKGDYDVVKDVLAKHGTIDFWSVRMRPAKPLAFGILEFNVGKTVPLIGLPGNPVSALVAFEHFCRPAIRKMLGKPISGTPTIKATLDEAVHNHDGRRVFARVIVRREGDEFRAKLTGNQNSNLLTSLAYANGLAICPENVAIKNAGDEVDVLMLHWPEELFLHPRS